MRLSPSAGVAVETVAPFPKPSKMYTIDWDHAPNSTSNWGITLNPGVTASTSTEQVLYTAPSTIKYAFPHFPHQNAHSNNNDDQTNMFQSTTTNGYYYMFKIGGRMIVGNSRNNSHTCYFNSSHNSYGDNYGGNTDGIDMYDVMVSYNEDYVKLLRKSHWIIHPGEDFVLFSGSASNSQTVYLQFEIHEFT